MEPMKGRRMLWAGDSQRRPSEDGEITTERKREAEWLGRGPSAPRPVLPRGGLACSASKVSRETVDHPRQLKLQEAVQRESPNVEKKASRGYLVSKCLRAGGVRKAEPLARSGVCVSGWGAGGRGGPVCLVSPLACFDGCTNMSGVLGSQAWLAQRDHVALKCLNAFF